MRKTVLALCLLLLPSLARAEKVAVFPVAATNLDAAQVDAVGALLAAAYAGVSGAEVIAPARAAGALKDNSDLPVAAKALGADQYLETSAIGLNGSIVLDVGLRAANGDLVHRAKITAASLEDVEPAVDRLANALFRRQTIDETRSIRNVTRADARGRNRAWTDNLWGVKAHMTAVMAAGNAFDPIGGLGLDWRRDTDTYFLEFGFGFLAPRSVKDDALGYGGLYAELGGSIYLTDANVAPYVGAGFLPRILMGDRVDDDITALPYVQGGVMFARDSSTRLYVDVRLAQNVLPVRDTNNYMMALGGPPWDPPSSNHYPTELGLEVGIGW